MTTKDFVAQVSSAAADRREAEENIIRSDEAVRTALKDWLNGRVLRDTAHELGISPAYLGDIRDGRRTISEAVLERLMAAKSGELQRAG